eukprot:3136753-Pyramimonas_sp.AAC.1
MPGTGIFSLPLRDWYVSTRLEGVVAADGGQLGAVPGEVEVVNPDAELERGVERDVVGVPDFDGRVRGPRQEVLGGGADPARPHRGGVVVDGARELELELLPLGVYHPPQLHLAVHRPTNEVR